MCTIVLITRAWPEQPLVVAANRDERYGRPAAPPAVLVDGALPVLAPRDLQAGGTWLGLNAAGLFAGITNRFGKAPDPRRRSRGELVRRALGHRDAEAAAADLGAVDARDYNGFHLVMADRRGARLVWGDGEELHCETLPAGVHVLTERSRGAAPTERERLLERELAGWPGPAPPDDAELRALLTIRAQPPIEGTLVDLPGIGYGTRSSTLLRLGSEADAIAFLHSDGPPDRTPFEDYSAAARGLVR